MDEVLAIRAYGEVNGLIEIAHTREAPALLRAGWTQAHRAPPFKVALRPPANARPDTLVVSGRFVFLRGPLAENARRALRGESGGEPALLALAYVWRPGTGWHWVHGHLRPEPAFGLPGDPHGLFAVACEPVPGRGATVAALA